MANWMMWLTLAGALAILELFSGTFYLLMLAVGLIAGAVAAYAGASLEIQIIVAAAVGVVATTILHRSRFGWQGRSDSERDPNVNLDVGQFIQIDGWQMTGTPGSQPTARVMYRGAPWDIELGDAVVPDAARSQGLAPQQASAAHSTELSPLPSPGRYRIVAVRGSRLIVAGSA